MVQIVVMNEVAWARMGECVLPGLSRTLLIK